MDGSGEQCRGGGPTSSEQIMETAGVLLRRFICDQIGPATKYVAQLALEQVAQDPHIKELVKVLKRKAKEALCTDMRELITSIVGWTLDFIRKRLLPWIQEQGGWDGLLSQYSNQIKWLAVAVAFIAVTVAIFAVSVDFTPNQQLHWPWSWILELAGWDGLLAQYSNQIQWFSSALAIIPVAVAIIAVLVAIIAVEVKLHLRAKAARDLGSWCLGWPPLETWRDTQVDGSGNGHRDRTACLSRTRRT